MPESLEYLKLGSALLGGGAMGAVLSYIGTSYRNRLQAIGRRIDISQLFKPEPGAAFQPVITVSDGTTSHRFENLNLIDLQVVNLGNRDLSSFRFGLTLNAGDRAVHVEPYGFDRHHVATISTPVTPANPSGDLDWELVPFNRGDSYSFKIFAVGIDIQLGPTTIGSPEAVRFTDVQSLASAVVKAAADSGVQVGPFRISFAN